MNTTQEHLAIADIKDDILILKDGGGAMVLEVSAVNFGLLSDREQAAIIGSFAQMLNSLSFSIQIVIVSQRLNISSYLNTLDRAQAAQVNSLLAEMIDQYKQFVQSLVKENEVLDKKFYIVIPLFSLELGLRASKENLEQKVKTVLMPRRDQIIRQLNRVGLKAAQLRQKDLIMLFYNVYSGIVAEVPSQPINPADLAVKLKNPQVPVAEDRAPAQSPPANPPAQQTQQNGTSQAQPPPPAAAVVTQTSKNHPFVVEELEE